MALDTAAASIRNAFYHAPEAVTPEGIRIPLVEGEAPAAEPFVAEMEGEAIKAGTKANPVPAKGQHAKVVPGEVKYGLVEIPVIEQNALTEVAKDLKCDESAALKQMKEYFSTGIVKDNRIEAMVDADTKIVFRKDFGEHAHPIKSHGYMSPVNHYNFRNRYKKVEPSSRIPHNCGCRKQYH